MLHQQLPVHPHHDQQPLVLHHHPQPPHGHQQLQPPNQLQLPPPPPRLPRQPVHHLLVRFTGTNSWLQTPRIFIFPLVWSMMVLTNPISTRLMVARTALMLTARRLRALSATHHGSRMAIATTNAGNCANNFPSAFSFPYF